MFNNYEVYDKFGSKIMSCFTKDDRILKNELSNKLKEEYTLKKCKISFFVFFEKEFRNFVIDILDSIFFSLKSLFLVCGVLYFLITYFSNNEKEMMLLSIFFVDVVSISICIIFPILSLGDNINTKNILRRSILIGFNVFYFRGYLIDKDVINMFFKIVVTAFIIEIIFLLITSIKKLYNYHTSYVYGYDIYLISSLKQKTR